MRGTTVTLKLSRVFVEDADFTNVVGMGAHCRLEIEKFHAPLFATEFEDTSLKIAETKIRFIAPEMAAVDARWEQSLRPHCRHLMVIDDLADRQHDCD